MGRICKEWYHPHGLQYQNSYHKKQIHISILNKRGPSIDR